MNDCIEATQRLKRDPMRFDVLDLFDSVGRSRKYELGSAEDIETTKEDGFFIFSAHLNLE